MPGPLRKVDLEQARRIAVRAQLLDGSACGVLDTVRRLGFLQLDPIATVAPPQHLVLWSRLGAFDRGELDRLLWDERKLIEWDAFLWPVESLPLLQARMREHRRSTRYAWQRWAQAFLARERRLPAVRPARARPPRAAALARPRGPRDRAAARAHLARAAARRPAARAAEPARRGRDRRPPRRAEAVRPPRALVPGDRGDPAGRGEPRPRRAAVPRARCPRVGGDGVAHPRGERRAGGRSRHGALPVRPARPRPRPHRGALRVPLPPGDVRARGQARVRLLRAAAAGRRPPRGGASSRASTARLGGSRCSARGATRAGSTTRSPGSRRSSAASLEGMRVAFVAVAVLAAVAVPAAPAAPKCNDAARALGDPLREAAARAVRRPGRLPGEVGRPGAVLRRDRRRRDRHGRELVQRRHGGRHRLGLLRGQAAGLEARRRRHRLQAAAASRRARSSRSCSPSTAGTIRTAARPAASTTRSTAGTGRSSWSTGRSTPPVPTRLRAWTSSSRRISARSRR